MYVCLCKSVTDRQIRSAVLHHDVNSMRELRACLGVCDQCGKCGHEAKKLLTETVRERNALEMDGALLG